MIDDIIQDDSAMNSVSYSTILTFSLLIYVFKSAIFLTEIGILQEGPIF